MSVSLDQMSPYARSVVHALNLEAHPEGGWYVRDWQSPHAFRAPLGTPNALALDGRPLASLIYFLLPEGDASAWHKVDADELWLWHGPAPVTLQLGGDGEAPNEETACQTITLGAGLTPATTAEPAVSCPTGHAIVPAGVWQRTLPGAGDALVSCVVSPGFTFKGFTLE